MSTRQTTYNTLDLPKANMSTHSAFHAFLIVAAFIVYLVMVALNALNSLEIEGLQLFISSVGNNSDKYPTDITPAGFTFSIWGLIYIWQAILVLYGLASICRKGVDGPLYRSPVLLPPLFYFIYIINNGLNTAWLFVWDREMLVASAIVLALDALTLYFCIAISMKYLSDKTGLLQKFHMLRERWWIWIGVQNGLAIYATWTSIATTLNLAIVLEYTRGVDHQLCGTISLSIVLGGFLFWSIFELAALDKHARYLFMPYIVVCWALGGAIAKNWGKNWEPTDRNAIYTAVILGIAVLLGIVKFIIMFVRHFRKPLHSAEITSTLDN